MRKKQIKYLYGSILFVLITAQCFASAAIEGGFALLPCRLPLPMYAHLICCDAKQYSIVCSKGQPGLAPQKNHTTINKNSTSNSSPADKETIC